jgi:hypothetical protein
MTSMTVGEPMPLLLSLFLSSPPLRRQNLGAPPSIQARVRLPRPSLPPLADPLGNREGRERKNKKKKKKKK